MTQSAADLRRLDLNLLPVFLVLMRERNVTRAGAALSLSQPATSAALARLRAFFNDPLFVANGRRLEPTPRAEALCSELDPALQMVSAAIFGSIPFEPTTANHVFHLGCTEDVMLVCRPMFRAMRRAAPKCGIVIHAANYRTIPSLLESGEIGTAFGYMDDSLPANVYRRVLGRGGFRVLRDASTPGPVDLDMFCARPHVLVTPRGDLRGFVDPILEKLGRHREIRVGVPDYGLLPHIIRGTEMLCTVNSLLAEVLTADDADLAADLPPFETQQSTMHMAWRATLNQDPAERWMRGRIVEFFGRSEDVAADENPRPN